jgi:hypothetical protein
MYIPAITLGYAVPAVDFEASVHSVFHSAMNLRLLDGNGLLTLVVSSEPDLPQGIRLDTPEGFSFENVQIGESAICREGILYFEDSHLSVHLSNARRWKCDLSKLEIDTGNPVISAAWSLVWEALNKRQKRLHAEIIADDLLPTDTTIQSGVSFRAGKAMCELVTATRQYNLSGTTAVEALIGLGAGLTPSGDDLLAGYMAGLWCTVRKKNDRAQFITQLGKGVIDLSWRTNDISRTYLFHAVHGQVSSRIAALAEAISRAGESNPILETAEQAMQSGSTSGMDTVTGLLLGISAWDATDSTNQ